MSPALSNMTSNAVEGGGAIAPVVSADSAQALAFSLAALQDATLTATASRISRSASTGDEESNDGISDDDEEEEVVGATGTSSSNSIGNSPIASTLDPVRRLARCRERNREHARRTRIRKKVQLEALQQKCKVLQAEQANLKRILEDRRVASILLNLSGNADPSQQQQLVTMPAEEGTAALVEGPYNNTTTTTRSRLYSPDHDSNKNNNDDFVHDGDRTTNQPLHLGKQPQSKQQRKSPQSNSLCITVDGVRTVFSTKSHVNWKTGLYLDDHGQQQRLDARQLESLRRERNRLHAKMTRDRKKCFLFNIQREIDDLEQHNQQLRRFVEPAAAVISPELTFSQSPQTRSTPHGFVLDT